MPDVFLHREFKIGDIPFNYGALPQTWEDPQWVHPDARCGGDDDPLGRYPLLLS